MPRIAYSTSSNPPTLRNAPPREYERETWLDWLARQANPPKRGGAKCPK